MSARVRLFNYGAFPLHSRSWSRFKIDCDALTEADWVALGFMARDVLPPFGSVEGVPRGGLALAYVMRQHISEGPLLIVDDVCTTGGSMEEHRAGRTALGLVIFSRGPTPSWVTSLFAYIERAVGVVEATKTGETQ